MSRTICSSRLCFFLSFTILCVLAQEVLIDHLRSNDGSTEGEIKTAINPDRSESIKGVALFGWIRID